MPIGFCFANARASVAADSVAVVTVLTVGGINDPVAAVGAGVYHLITEAITRAARAAASG